MTASSILCATELDAPGRHVADVAAAFAAARGLSLRLVHVCDAGRDALPVDVPASILPAIATLQKRIDARIADARAHLEQERVRLGSVGVGVGAQLVEGHPWEALLAESQRAPTAAIVVGRHGAGSPPASNASALAQRIVGSTADRVVRHAEVPVLVVPDRGTEPVTFEGGRWLVACDGSPSSVRAFEEALAVVARSGGEVEVLHVVRGPRRGDAGDWPEEVRAHAIASAESRLAAALAPARARAPGVSVTTSVHVGDPAVEILAHADGHAAIAIGTHARTARTFLLGSTAEKVLRGTALPVLCVRA